MQAVLDIRTLILVATLLMVCRAAAMVYVWFAAREYAPLKYWAAGSALTAAGVFLIGLRDLIPVLFSVALGQSLLLSGWLIIDAGIVIAAGQKPPWRAGIGIAGVGALMTGWFLVAVPDLALRTAFNSLPGMLFDCYAAMACLRAGKGRSRMTLVLLAILLGLFAASNLLKTSYINANDIQELFHPAWQIGQFYAFTVVFIPLSAVIFALLAAESLQEWLDRELQEHTRINRELGTALLKAEHFRAALDMVPACVYLKDSQARYTYANKPALALLGCAAEELPGSSDSRFFAPEIAERLIEVDKSVLAGQSNRQEVTIPDASGRDRIYLELKSPVYADPKSEVIDGLCCISTDITSLKEHEQHLEFVAHYDALTRLPNRILLADRLAQALAQARRRQTMVAVAFLDLDGFKRVNDNHGHDVGDGLLVALGHRMQLALREGDTLARMGGDEFVAIIVDLKQLADCEAILDRLLHAAGAPIMVKEIPVQVSASIGVAFYPEDGAEPDLLLRHADQAMYLAKKGGRNCYRRFNAAAEGQSDPPAA